VICVFAPCPRLRGSCSSSFSAGSSLPKWLEIPVAGFVRPGMRILPVAPQRVALAGPFPWTDSPSPGVPARPRIAFRPRGPAKRGVATPGLRQLENSPSRDLDATTQLVSPAPSGAPPGALEDLPGKEDPRARCPPPFPRHSPARFLCSFLPEFLPVVLSGLPPVMEGAHPQRAALW